MSGFDPQNPNFEADVRKSFARQKILAAIGATLVRVSAGEVVIELPFRSDLTQQHGYLHAGITTTILDTACGYAALSLMPAGSEVLTVEYKVNLLAPARGGRMIARACVKKPGRTLTVCTADAFAVDHETETPIATMLATMFQVRE
jgi:uncharacterized protein (TIGR00369 family)